MGGGGYEVRSIIKRLLDMYIFPEGGGCGLSLDDFYYIN